MLQPKRRLVYILFPPFLAVVLYLIFIISSNFSEPESFSWIFLAKSVVSFYCYLLVTLWFERLILSSGRISRPGWAQGLVFLSALLVSLIFSLLLYYLIKSTFIEVYGQNDQISRYHLGLQALNTFVGFTIVYSVHLSINYFNTALKKELLEEQYQREKLELRYKLLANQMDPHFLFNNLNTLHTLISESDPSAETFVLSLARIMRYSFQAQQDQLVEVDKELNILDEYLLIMKNRYGPALTYELSPPEGTALKILPMTLVNLLENAVKHNEISRDKPLRIQILITEDSIQFTNNRNTRIGAPTTGRGLKNLQQIYWLRFMKAVEIRKDDLNFTVEIPRVEV